MDGASRRLTRKEEYLKKATADRSVWRTLRRDCYKPAK